MTHPVRRFAALAGRCALCLLLAPVAARAQETAGEAPVPPQSIGEGAAGGGYSIESMHQMLLSGFGVADFTADWNSHDNTFAAGVLALAAYKPVTDRLILFGQVNVEREPRSPFLEGGGYGGGVVEAEIDNLFVEWRPAAAPRIDLTFGKFDSPLAIERDDAFLNLQATPSFTLAFARPAKLTGLQLHQVFSPHFEGWAILANGWNLDTDNNHGKSGAIYGLWSPSFAAHVGLGVIHGPEREDSSDTRTTAVGTLLFQPVQSWVWGGESVAGEEEGAAEDGGTGRWFAQTLFTHHRFSPHWAGTLRLEVLDDSDGARTGTAQTLRSVTLSPQYLAGSGVYGVFQFVPHTSLKIPEFSVRLDLRYDRSDRPVFRSGEEGVADDDYLSATLQTSFLF